MKDAFNILNLHKSIDVGAKSWICANGKDLHIYILSSIEKSNYTPKRIIKLFAIKHACSCGPAAEILYFNKEWIPLPFLIFLIKMKIINQNSVLSRIEFLKVNVAKAKPINAVKNLSENLCKIAGAHAADGNIHMRIGFHTNERKKLEMLGIAKKNIYKTKRGDYRFKTDFNKLNIPQKDISKDIKIWQDYNIDLTDEYKKAVTCYSNWLKDVFGTDIPVKRHCKKNAWRINFSNKIIARYLTEFLEFPIGEKTTIAKEPSIIAKSNKRYRNAFLKGLTMFDGCVNARGNIMFGSNSKHLIESANQIHNLNNITPRIYYDTKRFRWQLSLTKEQSKRALYCFEPNTEKYQKLSDKHGL